MLIDGYEVAGGVTECMAISNRVAADIRRTGRTPASALDLWIAIFGQSGRVAAPAFRRGTRTSAHLAKEKA